MTRQQKKSAGAVVGLLAVAVITFSLRAAAKESPAPERLLPANAVLYVGWDGTEVHAESWKGTAAYQSLVQSGLGAVVSRLFDSLLEQANDRDVRLVMATLGQIRKHGISLAVSLGAEGGPPLPAVTIVFPEAAEWEPQLKDFVEKAAGEETEFRTERRRDRNVTWGTSPKNPNIELGWWTEGDHLVISAGINAIDSTLHVAEGEAPNLTKSPLWTRYRAEAKFKTALVTWLNLAALRTLAAEIPLSQAEDRVLTVGELLRELGLDQVGAFAFQFGFRGKSLWSELTLEAPAPRRGLLAFADQSPLSLDELPPFPAGSSGVSATRMNWAATYNEGLRLVSIIAQAMGNPLPPPEELKARVPAMLGFDPLTELFDPLGDVVAFYSDSQQGLFGFGMGLIIEVRDAATLRRTLQKLLARLDESKDVEVHQLERSETLQYIKFPSFPLITPAFAVSDDWLAIGLTPQTVEAFLLREEGKLPRWQPDAEVVAALKELPAKYISLSVRDPRPGLQTLVSMTPTFVSLAELGMRSTGAEISLPIEAAEIPPVELVTRPLYPNVSVCSADEEKIVWTCRTSVPGIPLVGNIGAAGAGTVPILVALLLPAVQQARTAARRAQSAGKLKMLALALHNYHDTHNQLPTGTVPNEDLKPEEQLSWIVEILPFLEEAALYRKIDRKKGWEAEENEAPLGVTVQSLINPQVTADPETKLGVTHYVGMAGIGKDAPTLPVTDRKAGVFGYNRTTRFRDIRDGLSNTIGIAEAGGDYGPWGAGGKSTLRSLTKKPYINGPDGIGGPFPGGLNVMLMDGAVRFISRDIDPDVFEALMTINGGDKVGDF